LAQNLQLIDHKSVVYSID